MRLGSWKFSVRELVLENSQEISSLVGFAKHRIPTHLEKLYIDFAIDQACIFLERKLARNLPGESVDSLNCPVRGLVFL